jgi:hypothetical protein
VLVLYVLQRMEALRDAKTGCHAFEAVAQLRMNARTCAYRIAIVEHVPVKSYVETMLLLVR